MAEPRNPLGEIVADPARGLVYGNRGCLHDAHGRIRRAFAGKRWISCRLEFQERRWHPLMQPGRYTELFFLDEATAFAAGHRPCAECRREDYVRFTSLWAGLHPGQAGADAIDAQLHSERLGPRTTAPLAPLPNGAFVLVQDAPYLVLDDRLLRWSPGGYTDAIPRPSGVAMVITPPSLVAVLAAGWNPVVPLVHPSARDG